MCISDASAMAQAQRLRIHIVVRNGPSGIGVYDGIEGVAQLQLHTVLLMF